MTLKRCQQSMRFVIFFILSCAIFIWVMLLPENSLAEPHTSEFAGIEPYLIETPRGKITDLSGLALCNGKLLTVSDKINDTIFLITVNAGKASVTPALTIPTPPAKDSAYHGKASLMYLADGLLFPGRQDWEGIACADNAIYLISERKNAVLKISKNISSWLPLDWYETLYQQGYLHQYNAFVEGIAVYGPDHLLVAIERNPRGILDLKRIDLKGTDSLNTPNQNNTAEIKWRFTSAGLSNDKQLDFRGNNPDLADIVFFRDSIYTLERNASAICQRNATTLQTHSCFSYASIENNPVYRYADSNFGLGEGLAIDDQWVYVVFDTNDKPRLSDPRDRRSLLLRMPLPAEWRTP